MSGSDASPPASVRFQWSSFRAVLWDLDGVITPTAEIHERAWGELFADHGYVADDYLAYLDALYNHLFESIDRRRVTVHVLGFSQGAATASRWTTLGHAEADRLILWAGDLAHDLDLAAHAETLRRLTLTLVVGTDDEFVTPKRLAGLEALLIEHSIPYRLRPFKGPHRMDAETLALLTEE